jgi:hypothetical protein
VAGEYSLSVTAVCRRHGPGRVVWAARGGSALEITACLLAWVAGGRLPGPGVGRDGSAWRTAVALRRRLDAAFHNEDLFAIAHVSVLVVGVPGIAFGLPGGQLDRESRASGAVTVLPVFWV